ncbi:acyltransferase [Gordonia alkaliphila]|nr:acyltransferase [Gordonia alkaliphila]
MGVAFGHVAQMNAPITGTELRLWPLGLALNLFFAASGFLLYLQFAARFMTHKPMPDMKRYANRRFFRIFPGYIVIFLLVNFLFQASYLENQLIATAQQKATGDFGLGVGMITDPPMLLSQLSLTASLFPQYMQTGISPAWSLTLELSFYLSLPISGWLLWMLARRTSMPKAWIVLVPPILLIALSSVGKYVADRLSAAHGGIGAVENGFGPTWIAVLSRSFLVLADTFAFGMLASVVFLAISAGKPGRKTIGWLRVGAVVMMIGLVPVLLTLRDLHTRFDNMALSALSMGIIIFITSPFAAGRTSWLSNAIDSRYFYRLGTISLSIYLWHYPVLLFTRRMGWYGDDSISGLAISAAIVLIPTILLSEVTYRLVEAPALRCEFKRRPNGWPTIVRS